MKEEIDLNLLRVFDAMMDAGSVSGAAARLHLSIPAASRALSRLRAAMGDPILVRAGRGLVPTPFAESAAVRVKSLLHDADRLRKDSAGDPSTWRRTFTIRINDGLAPVLAPKLTHAITEQAPGVRLRFVAQESKGPDLLRDGSLDLDVGVAGPPPPDVSTSALFSDHFVAVVGAGSDLGRKASITVDDLCAYPHVSASRRGLARGPIDAALEARGRARNVVAIVSTYVVGALMVVEGELICMLPSLMATHLVHSGLALQAHAVPLELPEATVEQRWHQRVDQDVASQWLRRTMDDVATSVSHGAG